MDDSRSPDGSTDESAHTHPAFDARAALRRGTESGPLFGDRYRGAEATTDPGLIGGDSDDPLLVAGIGYPLLGDLALGTVVAYRVAEWRVPGIAVADCSHTPVAAAQTITGGDHGTVLLVGSEKRGDGELNDGTASTEPGRIREYSVSDVADPDEGERTARIGESAMGSNTVENVVVVTRAMGGFPDDAWVFTVEPAYDSWGTNVDEFTEPIEAALEDVLERVAEHVERVLDTPEE